MIIVGELINASRTKVAEAIKIKDAYTIKKLALDQKTCGAAYIDVNAGVFVGQEAHYLAWLVEKVQSVVEGPCCLDSPDPKAIEAALAVHAGTAMINSISLEKKRLSALLPLVAGSDLKVIALCMSDAGMPETADQRLVIADQLINRLVANGVPPENIFVDPLVQPVSTQSNYGREFLAAVARIHSEFRGVHTVCGLSNVSFGLPNRPLVNRTFMAMAVGRGLDAAIVNPLDRDMMASVTAAEVLAGRDKFCSGYLQFHRSGR